MTFFIYICKHYIKSVEKSYEKRFQYIFYGNSVWNTKEVQSGNDEIGQNTYKERKEQDLEWT